MLGLSMVIVCIIVALILVVLGAVQLGAFGDDIPRWGDE